MEFLAFMWRHKIEKYLQVQQTPNPEAQVPALVPPENEEQKNKTFLVKWWPPIVITVTVVVHLIINYHFLDKIKIFKIIKNFKGSKLIHFQKAPNHFYSQLCQSLFHKCYH